MCIRDRGFGGARSVGVALDGRKGDAVAENGEPVRGVKMGGAGEACGGAALCSIAARFAGVDRGLVAGRVTYMFGAVRNSTPCFPSISLTTRCCQAP
eukprot:3991382-Prymnesium_polylepis.1